MEILYNDIYAPISAEDLARIPEEMRAEKRWICWGSNKIPVSVTSAQNGTHYGINVTVQDNWGTFQQATAAIGNPAYVKYADENFHIVGVGFVVGDGWFCADLDGGAGHKKEDVPESVVNTAINTIGTYTEKSLSGSGYHIFGKCDFYFPNAESNKPHRGPDGEPVPESYEIEFFTRRKFIAVTGRIVPGSKPAAKDCSEQAYCFYRDYIQRDRINDEAKRATERAERIRAIPLDRNDANSMFLLNYRNILAASDSSNFKRGGPGVKLAPGEYSWIAAVKAMQEIGIPESDIIDWCRRGSNFKSEKDVKKVLDKTSKPGTATVAGIVEDAKAHGWKPDPDKLTGEYKANHDKAEYERRQLEKFRAAHKEEHTAALAAVGIDCAGDPYRFTWKYDFDRSITEVIEKETGEIVYQKPAAPVPDPEQPIPGKTVITTPGAKEPEKNKKPVVVGFDNVEIKETDYLFFPWFPRGKLVAIQGDSSSSKSTFMYAVGANVSTGADLLGAPCEDPGNVMFLTIEDDPGDILISFLDAGGNKDNLKRIENREDIARMNLSETGAQQINTIIKENNIKLLVLDPIQQFINGDMNKATETRPQLARLMNIAAENNICIAFLEHLGKDTTKSALHRGIGSVDIGAATRSVLQIVPDPEDDYFKIAFTVKNNTADIHETQKAIRYQVKDHPGSYDPVKKKRHRFHGHAEFTEILPEYNERIYRKAQRKAAEDEEKALQAEIDYHSDPLVITVRALAAQNPAGLFIGASELIKRITEKVGRCPYDQSRNKITGINSRIAAIRARMMEDETAAIQMDLSDNALKTRPYHWNREIITPEVSRERGVTITPIKNGSSGSQQTEI